MRRSLCGVVVAAVCAGMASFVDACGGPSGSTDGGPDATTSDVATNDVAQDVNNDAITDASCTDGSATDPNNCGACGHVCTGGVACYSGVCGNEAIEVSAGLYSACAIMGDQTVWCWGDNGYGEIGASSSGDVACSGGPCRPVAQQVVLGGAVKGQHISVGNYFACLVDTTGMVWCWGRNDHGQLGHLPSTDVFDAGGVSYDYTPTSVSGLPTGMGVAAGRESACIVTTAGAVWCWGDDSTNELAGMEAGAPVSPPTAAQVLTSQVQTIGISATVAEDHLCARKTDGTVWCWADNFYGERGSTSDSGTPPSEVIGSDGGALTDIAALAVPKWGTCALRSGGTLWCWGENAADDFGNPNLTAGQMLGPVPTESDSGTVVFAGINGRTIHMCGLTPTSDLYCWGDNLFGEIGIGAGPDAGPYNTVQKVPSFLARAVAAGYFFTVAIKTDGTVWAWGYNSVGQLGHAQSSADMNGCSTYCSLSPTQVQGLPHP